MASQAERGEQFKALHARKGAFIIPNPWDVGTACMLEGMGFEALATTSSGFATALGRFDGQVTRDEKMQHCREICAAVDIPVSADLENCFSDTPEGVAETVRLAAETGLGRVLDRRLCGRTGAKDLRLRPCRGPGQGRSGGRRGVVVPVYDHRAGGRRAAQNG